MGLMSALEPLMIIPESIVEEAAEACKDDKDNNFKKVLNAGREFKAAGLTPIYVLDEHYMDLIVIAKELYRKKLH
jgi:hypothetical protein